MERSIQNKLPLQRNLEEEKNGTTWRRQTQCSISSGRWPIQIISVHDLGVIYAWVVFKDTIVSYIYKKVYKICRGVYKIRRGANSKINILQKDLK